MISILLALALVFPQSVSSGLASWYADPRAAQGSLYAAVPGYRFGHPFYVHVRPSTPTAACRIRTGNAACRIRVLVKDSCQCHVGRSDEKSIDLSWRAFSMFAPLSRGVVRVVIER